MSASKVAAICEGEEARNVGVRAARERRDAAAQEYARTRRVLARLEGRENRHKGGSASEQKLQAAREDVSRSRLAWQSAQRELLRSI